MTIAVRETVDALFMSPYVDVDEWRERPHRHRFVHGGFAGTETRFSFYFPPAARYGGRFLTSIEGGQAGHESRAVGLQGDRLGSIGFAFECGAYLVESNGGHIVTGPVALTRAGQDATVTAYRATAAATRFARQLAAELYGARPHHGYIVGGSGGGRALLGLENTSGIWDGCVQYVNAAGHGVSMPCVVGNVVRLLGPKVRDVARAHEPGGSADPFAGLDTRQREELAVLYRSGFQPGAEFQLEAPAPEFGVFLITSTLAADFDLAYFDDFWTVPGYLGADGGLDGEVIHRCVTVRGVLDAQSVLDEHPAAADTISPALKTAGRGQAVAVRIDADVGDARGAALELADGTRRICIGSRGDVLIADFATGGPLAGVARGDVIGVDNRRYLAYCYSYRHQVDPEAAESRQFMVGGRPIYPQRTARLQDVLVGVRMRAEFDGRLIYVGSVLDSISTTLGTAVTYAGQVREKLGTDARDRLRVWLNDKATHVQASQRPPGPPPVATTRLVDWLGSIEQAVFDLIAWCEDGVAPPPDTSFSVDDGRIVLPELAAERGGIQPIVSATANGAESATVAAGSRVELRVVAEAPEGTGTIVAAEWDFDGTGRWPFRHAEVDGGRSRIELAVAHTFDVPGTYFPAVRVSSHREGRLDTATRTVPNLARVRVDVAVGVAQPATADAGRALNGRA